MLFLCFAIWNNNKISVIAETDEKMKNEIDDIGNFDEFAEPYGLYTNLTLAMNGGENKVIATVKNNFTLFPSIVNVIVQLYSTYDYEEDYKNMTLMSYNSIEDLDQGKTISTEAPTNGEQKFWIARMRYRIDNKEWNERIVGPAKYSASGEYIGLT